MTTQSHFSLFSPTKRDDWKRGQLGPSIQVEMPFIATWYLQSCKLGPQRILAYDTGIGEKRCRIGSFIAEDLYFWVSDPF